MAYALGVLVLVVGTGVSFALHELGHFLPARRFGVRCPRFMIGFGPTLWSTRRGDTEYGIKALPFGAFVRLLGMYPPRERLPAPGNARRLSEFIEQARDESFREVGPDDKDRLFYQRSVPQRLVILVGGPGMNLIFAVVMMTVMISGFGLPMMINKVGTVSACVLPTTAPAGRTCTPNDPPAPAAQAGLHPGDRIASFDGHAMATWAQVRDAIRANKGTAVPVTVERDGRRLDLTVTPLVDKRVALDAKGGLITGPDGQPELAMVGFLGITPVSESMRQPLTAVPGIVGDSLSQVVDVVLHTPQKMVGVAQAAFGSAQRDPESPVSIVGVGRFAGEVGSAQGSATAPISLSDRIVSWLSLLVSLNLALFVFNLIPLLPLDGGHIAGVCWEGVRCRIAQLRRRPDPGPVDIARGLPLALGVVSIFIVMSVLLIYAHIVRPVSLGD